MLRWWQTEGITTADLTTRLGVIRGTSIPTLGDDEPVPHEREMWMMAWALCRVGKPQYAALALVMGSAGLRIGECCERRRRGCTDGPKGGMWISVRAHWRHLAERGPTPATASSDEALRRRDPTVTCVADAHTFSPPRRRCCVPTLEQFSARPADARVFTSTTGRHLDVAHLQQRAWKLRTAARWGGWKDVATMLRWYESRLPGDDELAAGRLADGDDGPPRRRDV